MIASANCLKQPRAFVEAVSMLPVEQLRDHSTHIGLREDRVDPGLEIVHHGRRVHADFEVLRLVQTAHEVIDAAASIVVLTSHE